jgi:hypothetical protein
METARTYLALSNRTILTIVPAGPSAAGSSDSTR